MIADPVQKTLLIPSGLCVAQDDSPFGTFGWLVTTSREYLLLQARTICPTASVTISGLSLSTPTRMPLASPTSDADAEAGEDRDGELVVRACSDAGDQVAAEGDHPGRRQVDARVHDHEHLAERRDREDGRDREDVRPRGAAAERPALRSRRSRRVRRWRATPAGSARRPRPCWRVVERGRPRIVPLGAALEGWPRPRDILTRSGEQCQ